MTKKAHLIFSGFLLISTVSYAQVFQGTVQDASDENALSYANIGVINKSIGGISNVDGSFEIEMSTASPNDTLMISYIGYNSKIYVVSDIDFSQDHLIQLEPSATQLPKVQIIADRQANRFGNYRKRTKGFTGWGYNQPKEGIARGTVVQLNGTSILLRKFAVNIKHNTFDSVRFRLHMFDFKDGKAGKQLLSKNIFFTCDKKGWTFVDLKDYNIWCENDFLIAVEWVDAWSDKKVKSGEQSHMLTLVLSKTDGYFIVRKAPHDQWQINYEKRCPALYVEAFQYDRLISTDIIEEN